MKLRAKSDHRIREFGIDERNSHPYYTRDEYGNTCHYKTLKEVADNWEEVPEEPKDFWYIDDFAIMCGTEGEFTTPDLATFTRRDIERLKEIGNYFDTKEEAEKAVEKLKAWKRLEDKGFRFTGWRTWEDVTGLACFDKGVAHSYYAGFTFRSEDRLEKDKQTRDDLDFLFGGEE